MPIVELSATDFTINVSGLGTFYTDPDSSTYIVDSILPGSTSGNRSLRISWNEDVFIRWLVGRPPRTFGWNIRIGIAIKYINFNFLQDGKRARAGIFIGDISAGIEVRRISSTVYHYFLFLQRGSSTLASTQIYFSYFEQIILRQETNQILFHYSFNNPNSKNLINTLTYSTTPSSGQAGFFLLTDERTNGTVLFDYFFVDEFVGA
jgi:hypothetical protein